MTKPVVKARQLGVCRHRQASTIDHYSQQGPGRERTVSSGLAAASPLRFLGKVYRIGKNGKRGQKRLGNFRSQCKDFHGQQQSAPKS